MVKLILMSNNNLIGEYPFLQSSMTIGRQSDNAIVIDNFAVSRRHAKVEKVGSDFVITDLQSTNGTWVNGEQIVSQKLSHGDAIVIGKHVLLFNTSEKEEIGLKAEAADMDQKKTMVLERVQAVHGTEKVGVLSFIAGSDLGEIEVTKPLIKIGKAVTSDIRLPGLFMAATAATIGRRPTGFILSFVGGVSRLKVNGEVVRGTAELNDMDTIQLGRYKFQFYEKKSRQSPSL
jgi:pSer/pThr/pTyr-binding forkhead associated (FHA) protein